MSNLVVVYTAIACPNTPGPAGAGIVFTSERGEPLARGYRFLGELTNHEAAYYALLISLAQAENRGYKQLLLRTNSELLVRQLQGVYRVKHPNLQPLHAEAVAKLERFTSWQAEYIQEAARLAKKALQANRPVVVAPTPV